MKNNFKNKDKLLKEVITYQNKSKTLQYVIFMRLLQLWTTKTFTGVRLQFCYDQNVLELNG